MPLKVLRMFWRNSHSRMLFLDETIRSLPNAYIIDASDKAYTCKTIPDISFLWNHFCLILSLFINKKKNRPAMKQDGF